MRQEASQGFAVQHAMVQKTALVAANMIALAPAGQVAPGLPGSQIFFGFQESGYRWIETVAATYGSC